MTKARFIYLLLVASMFAYALAALFSAVHGFGDGRSLDLGRTDDGLSRRAIVRGGLRLHGRRLMRVLRAATEV